MPIVPRTRQATGSLRTFPSVSVTIAVKRRLESAGMVAVDGVTVMADGAPTTTVTPAESTSPAAVHRTQPKPTTLGVKSPDGEITPMLPVTLHVGVTVTGLFCASYATTSK